MMRKKADEGADNDGDDGAGAGGGYRLATPFERQQRSYQRRLELYSKERMRCEASMARARREGDHEAWHTARERLEQVRKKIAKMKRLLFL